MLVGVTGDQNMPREAVTITCTTYPGKAAQLQGMGTQTRDGNTEKMKGSGGKHGNNDMLGFTLTLSTEGGLQEVMELQAHTDSPHGPGDRQAHPHLVFPLGL